jgi:hypothetical protein
MKSIPVLAAAALLSALFAAAPAGAAPAGPQSGVSALQPAPVSHPVHYRHRHHHWRHSYWRPGPWGPPYLRGGYWAFPVYRGYYRPVRYGHCRAWARECAWRWGSREWRGDRCMRNHAC